MTEVEFCEAVEYICKYPYRKMWLKTGSFDEVLAYLEGYSRGAKLGTHGHHTFTVPFGYWLAKKFPSERESNILDWDDYREIFPDEEDAISNLPILYREFAESSHLKNLGC